MALGERGRGKRGDDGDRSKRTFESRVDERILFFAQGRRATRREKGVVPTLAISRIEVGIKNGVRASNLGFQMEA